VEMMKKKNAQAQEKKQTKADYITDNKATISQEKDNTNDLKDASAEILQGELEKSDSSNAGIDSNSTADKDVKQEVSVEEKLAEMQDRYLRLSAEFDNYRKRTLREKIELTKHAGENILMSIVPVMDDFERALKLMETATDCTAMKSGIDLIYNKFNEFLRQNGIKEIESLNKDFNVDLHEAITKVPAQDESMKGKVIDVVLKGYWLHDKVMRHSKVVVGE
jgi:molecular chaperone GrpE